MEVIGILGMIMILSYVYLIVRYENRDERFHMINVKSHVWAVSFLLFGNLVVQILNYLGKADKMFTLGFTIAIITVSLGYVLGFVHYSKVM